MAGAEIDRGPVIAARPEQKIGQSLFFEPLDECARLTDASVPAMFRIGHIP
jgi:hypothetical protein